MRMPPTRALNATPVEHMLLLATAATSPAHLVPCLRNSFILNRQLIHSIVLVILWLLIFVRNVITGFRIVIVTIDISTRVWVLDKLKNFQ
jgi:hypothetical protein